MKSCPICATSYSAEHRTCPTHGTVLVETQELPAGTMIRDCYRIVRMLGKGGMGTVYLAEHTLMGEQRALKFLSTDLASNPQFVQRFLQEARAANKLRHPNVAQTMELGQTEDGSFYISMEFVDGPSLRAALSQSPGGLPLERAFHIVRGAAMGLGAAHAKHMVHRDVKPENILLASTPEGEVAKVVDFGIVAMSDGAARLTQTGSVLLTCEYAAPEQWRGTIPSSELDGRTDLYSVGCMFFEMLTGRLPYKSETYEGWFQLHVNSEPPVPSSLRPEMAQYPGLDAITLKLLAKEREDRPANVHAFLSELDAVLAGRVAGPVAESVTAPRAAAAPAYEAPRAQTVVEAPAQQSSWNHTGDQTRKFAAAAGSGASTSGQFGAGGETTWQPMGQANWPAQPATPAPSYSSPSPSQGAYQTPPQGMPAHPQDFGPSTAQPYGPPQGGGALPPPQYAQAGPPQYAAAQSGGYPTAKKKSPIGLIIGGIAAVVVVAGLAVGAGLWYAHKKDPGNTDQTANQTQTAPPVTKSPAQPVVSEPATSPTPETPTPDVSTSLPSANEPPADTAKPVITKTPTKAPEMKNANGIGGGGAKQGLDLFKAGQFAQALPLLTKACDGGNATSCADLGAMYQFEHGVAKDYTTAITLYTKACNGGNMLGCNNMADMYQHGNGVALDYATALSLYTKACNGGAPDACNNLGVMYRTGRGVGKDSVRALALYQKACDGGNADGCSDLGAVYKNGGDGVSQDLEKAKTYLDKGCKMGSKFGCEQRNGLN
jgi:eukaryotic-like serine/threonine-protein kinase